MLSHIMNNKEGDKVIEIFRELVGERAEKLSPTHFPADINDVITSALMKENPEWTEEELLRKDLIGLNLVGWNREAAFLVALILSPEKFKEEEIQEEVGSLLAHVPLHVQEAEEIYNE